MKPSDRGYVGFIIDASVLIDYMKSDITVLTHVSRSVAPIHLASPVLAEVEQISENSANSKAIHVVEPSLEQVRLAVERAGRVSFQDRLCALMARDNEWACITSDRQLRSFCRGLGVPCVWGLEPLRWLVSRGHLTTDQAIAIARQIAESNTFITSQILARFRRQLGL